MKKKDKKLNKKALKAKKKAAKKAKKNKNLTVVDKVKNTVASINKDTVVDFAKKNAKVLIAAGSAIAVLAVAGIAASKKKAAKARK